MPVSTALADEIADSIGRKRWERSRNGNLWRKSGGVRQTIFKKASGWYGLCVAGPKSVEFYGPYITERKAVECASLLHVR